MIINFEDFTHNLTEYEKRSLLPIMVRNLRAKIGKQSAITNKSIVEALTSQGLKVGEARVRKIINYIRIRGIVKNLIATSKGYYVSSDQYEIDRYVESLRQRAGAIQAIADTFGKQNEPGQLNLKL